jgi:hypothetical protein
MWQNPGKIGLWQVVGNPGNFTGPGVVHFGWFSGVLEALSLVKYVVKAPNEGKFAQVAEFGGCVRSIYFPNSMTLSLIRVPWQHTLPNLGPQLSYFKVILRIFWLKFSRSHPESTLLSLNQANREV